MNRVCEKGAVAIGVNNGSNLSLSPFFLGFCDPRFYGELKGCPPKFRELQICHALRSHRGMDGAWHFDVFLSSGPIHERCGRKVSYNKRCADVLRDPKCLLD